VNVSPLQLRSRGFIAEVKQAIGIDAQAAAGLELEITESLIMENTEHSIATLQAIRALGVTIAIDDFGTGFSSLSYLAKLPVDTLKIDRSFVYDMTAGPEGLALVSTIINLARSLKLKVVAEGVETEEQSCLLRLLDCDEMQGYLFSKPVPGEIFENKIPSPASHPGKITVTPGCSRRVTRSRVVSKGVASADHSEQDDHEGDHQKNVDETAHGGGGDKPQEPEDQENNSNGIEHGNRPFVPAFQCKQSRCPIRATVDRHEQLRP
jgi:predicted signal transduction protein with EAL and GGDEF domain